MFRRFFPILSPSTGGAHRRAYRPRLELLEDCSVPATFRVTTALDVIDQADRKQSLREAITAANARPGPDVIVIPAGTFQIGQAGPFENANATGNFDVTDTVTIRGAGAGRTFLDGGQLDRLFHVRGTSTAPIQVILERLTIRNGAVSGPGGGIAVEDAALTVRDAAVTDNRAIGDRGGGIWGDDGAGSITLIRSTVARNSTTDDADGGGIFAAATVVVTNSQFRRNTSSRSGGGIFAGTVNLTNSTVSGNLATAHGGGVYATFGTLTRATISGNSAAGVGGGVYATTGIITRCAISGNMAGLTGGGINATTPDLFGAFTSDGHNLIGVSDGGTGFANGVNGDRVGTAAAHLDPLLGPLAANGGRTQTHKLLAGSPAIDAGDDGLTGKDQRGGPRKKDGNGDGRAAVDIGAFER